MKLFQLRDTRTNKLVPGLFFTDKTRARMRRTELNPKNTEGEEIMHYVITPGPDHHRFVKGTA